MTEVGCWRDQAACRDLVTADYDPFFADTEAGKREAIGICTACPVRDDRLTFAVRTGQQYGIWGGQPQQIIRRLIAADRAGRPKPAARRPAIPRPARPTASAAIPSAPTTPTTPRTAIAAAGLVCGRPSPSEPRKKVARMWRDRDRYPSTTTSPTPSGWWWRRCCSPPVGWSG